MAIDLYTDRRVGPRPRTEDTLSNEAWRAFVALMQSRLNDHSFGCSFPEVCPDGAQYGCDEGSFHDALRGVVGPLPNFNLQFRGPEWGEPVEPPTDPILDALEWCAGKIGQPRVIGGHHDRYYSHDHLRWDREAGRELFVAEVNQILARNELAFEMAEDGRIHRLVEGPSADALKRALFQTGDPPTDALLERARERFFDRDAAAGQDAVEALWDAFERLKTLEDSDKKTGASKLLSRVAPNGTERSLLEEEMVKLTKIGNDWRIRHHEMDKHPLGAGRDLGDYLFLRLFSLIQLLLSRTGRLACAPLPRPASG